MRMRTVVEVGGFLGYSARNFLQVKGEEKGSGGASALQAKGKEKGVGWGVCVCEGWGGGGGHVCAYVREGVGISGVSLHLNVPG